jgi:2-polyprenyl-3-methyl-5-hydroxy-6-metoxy-1,4-benzoquinol methylase
MNLTQSSRLDISQLDANHHRLDCIHCDYQINSEHPPEIATFRCNVRAHLNDAFRVWRCPNCETIHCLEKVDLNFYYQGYPMAQAELNFSIRACYRNILEQFKKHDFSPTHKLLDYGCANGIIIESFKELGFNHCYGYEPYDATGRFGNPDILQQGPFDYILLQDVLEHVEDPRQLLKQLDQVLAPGGYILIGMPRADRIDLTQPDCSDYGNVVHVPYHLFLLTPTGLEQMGREQGWQAVEFFGRAYHDTRWLGVNSRTWNAYQRLGDGAIDAIVEPIDLGMALRSPDVLLSAMFGYWTSLHLHMAVMFRKPGL